jgi:hypothetical protein
MARARRMTAAERDTQRATVVELRSVRVKFAEIGKRRADLRAGDGAGCARLSSGT